MASPSPARRILPSLEAASSPRQPAALTEDLLEEIFVRVASPTDLARASTACVSFRRLITDAGFLRRYRSLHPPVLLGFLSFRFQPVDPPHPNAPAARALDWAAGFSFFYLPRGDRQRWHPCDVRDGRVLLTCAGGGVFPEVAVCDPLSRRYLVLPPIPEDLLVSVQVRELEAFLVPSGDYEETSFRVIGWTHWDTGSALFVFSSVSGCWSAGTSASWDDLGLRVAPEGLTLGFQYYAYGCFYWNVKCRNRLLKLDISRMEFSIIDYPPGHVNPDVVIVEAGEGRIGMFSHVKRGTSVHYAIRQNVGENANEWRMENIIPLPAIYDFSLRGAAEGYIFLVGYPKVHNVCSGHFSLEIKTLKIDRVSGITCDSSHFNGKIPPMPLQFSAIPNMPSQNH
ncbi:hypothetical protein ACP70R_005633 [Stipagrostis hirtigluma subsp. patula]